MSKECPERPRKVFRNIFDGYPHHVSGVPEVFKVSCIKNKVMERVSRESHVRLQVWLRLISDLHVAVF